MKARTRSSLRLTRGAMTAAKQRRAVNLTRRYSGLTINSFLPSSRGHRTEQRVCLATKDVPGKYEALHLKHPPPFSPENPSFLFPQESSCPLDVSHPVICKTLGPRRTNKKDFDKEKGLRILIKLSKSAEHNDTKEIYIIGHQRRRTCNNF